MQISASSSRDSESAIRVSDIQRLADSWLLAGDIQQHSPRTLGARRDVIDKLLWYLRRKRVEELDVHACRGFLHYLTHGHTEPGGRWGNPLCTKPVSPRTVETYYGHLKAWMNWLVSEEEISASPMRRIPNPIARDDQVEPFTSEQIHALLHAARRGTNPRRDVALLLFLLDTGARSGEMVGIKVGDIEFLNRRVRVLGKGNKERTLSFQGRTARALMDYLRERAKRPEDLAFRGIRGPLTQSGVRQIVAGLGEQAGIRKCHPHKLRHTFAIEFLRSGGNVFTLQQILGHTHLQMTQRYVAIAQADVEVQHRKHSPVERLLGRPGR